VEVTSRQPSVTELCSRAESLSAAGSAADNRMSLVARFQSLESQVKVSQCSPTGEVIKNSRSVSER